MGVAMGLTAVGLIYSPWGLEAAAGRIVNDARVFGKSA